VINEAQDINKVIVPYVYRPFPKCLHKPDGSSKVVADEAQMDAALRAGWYLTPGPQEPAVADPLPVVQDVAGWPLDGFTVDTAGMDVVPVEVPEPAPVKRGPGRPRKVV